MSHYLHEAMNESAAPRRQRGRPRADRLELLERVADELALDPNVSGSELARRLAARRTDVLRIVRALRRAESREG